MTATQTCTATPAGDGQPLTLVCTTAQPVSVRKVAYEATMGEAAALFNVGFVILAAWLAVELASKALKYIKARFFGAGA